MKNQSIQFEIIDHRKSKSQPQWVTMYLAQIRIYLKPINMFGEIEQPTIESIYYATNTIIEKLVEIRSHSRQVYVFKLKFTSRT